MDNLDYQPFNKELKDIKNTSEGIEYLANQQLRSCKLIKSEFFNKKTNKIVDTTIRNFYQLILDQRINKQNRFDITYLSDHLRVENEILLEAIDVLQKQNILTKDKNSIILNAISNMKKRKYVVYIEKIIPGKALVIVNGEWQAILIYYDYDGPRDILKNGVEFIAIADFYVSDGCFCIKIKEIAL